MLKKLHTPIVTQIAELQVVGVVSAVWVTYDTLILSSFNGSIIIVRVNITTQKIEIQCIKSHRSLYTNDTTNNIDNTSERHCLPISIALSTSGLLLYIQKYYLINPEIDHLHHSSYNTA